MTPPSERMSRVDTAWLRMDSPRNLMMIVGVWLLRPGARPHERCAGCETGCWSIARFRQKVVRDAALGRSWVDDTDFDTASATSCAKRCRASAARASAPALQQRAAELATEPLDPAHPLWQIHLIDAYEGGSALIVRIHHCIADGIALTR